MLLSAAAAAAAAAAASVAASAAELSAAWTSTAAGVDSLRRRPGSRPAAAASGGHLKEGRRPAALSAAFSALAGLLLGAGSPSQRAGAEGLEDLIGEASDTGTEKPRKTVTGPEHDQAVDAGNQLRSLQKRWDSIVAEGNPGAGKIVQVLSGSGGSDLEITVAAGAPVGVEVEAKTVNSVSRPELGWKKGDVVTKINGVECETQEILIKTTQEAKSKGVPLVFTVNRRTQSPFITIEKCMQIIYGDADALTVLPEPSEVSKELRELKIQSELAILGIIEFPDLLKLLNQAAKDVAQFEAA